MPYKHFFQYNSKISTYYFVVVFLVIFTASVIQFWLQKFTTLEGEQTIVESLNAETIETENAILEEKIKEEVNEVVKLQQNRVAKGEFVISSGDTLAAIFEQAEISNTDSYHIVKAISKVFNPRSLKIGHTITIDYDTDRPETPIAKKIIIRVDTLKNLEVLLNEKGHYIAKLIYIPLNKFVTRKSTTINSSFIGAAAKLSIPHHAIMEMVRAYSYDVDFQRDVKSGNKMDVIVERFYTKDGKYSHDGDVLYSSLTLNNKKIDIFKFTNSSGDQSYYNKEGYSIHKTFLKTPVNATRISSKFGKRKHPVLGYTRMHKGIDFAAPTGTPIFAAGSGIVVKKGVNGGYGNYIKIKHNNTYSTAYGHISRFKKDIRVGSKVKQGQIIAYVGKTGLSSGPHLHYEVIKNGKQINPMTVKSTSSGNKLAGKDLQHFNQTVAKIKSLVKELQVNKEIQF